MEALEDQQHLKRKEQIRIKAKAGMKRFREEQTPEKKKDDRIKSKEGMKRFRGEQTPEKKEDDRIKTRVGTKRYREAMSEEEVDSVLESSDSENEKEDKFRCKHYKRKCQFVVSK